MTILSELNKLKASKTQIRKAIQQQKTGLQTSENFNTYPTYIAGMSDKVMDNTGLIDYCEDYLTTYTINTTSIRDYAFYKWTNLHVLRIPSLTLVPLQGTHAFDGTNLTTIAVPASLLNSYKTATNWSNYADKFVVDNMILNASTWMNKNAGINNGSGVTYTKVFQTDSSVPSPVLKVTMANSATTAKGGSGIFIDYGAQIGTLDKMELGETYTYSFYAKGDTNLTLSPGAVCESQTLVSSTGFSTLTSSWRRHTVTFKWTMDTKLTACFYVTVPASTTSTFYLAGLMLQKGSTASTFVNVPVVQPTVLIEHLQDAGRTVEYVQSLTLEQFITDFR